MEVANDRLIHELLEIARHNPFSNIDDHDDKLFYSQVDAIRDELDVLQAGVNALNEIYDQNLIRHSSTQHNVDKQKTFINDIESRISDDIQKLSHVLPTTGPSSREARVKVNIHAALVKDFVELQRQFKSVQDEYEEEIQRLVESKEISSKVAARVEEAKRAFLEKAKVTAKSRKKHFLKKDRSLADVGWLFVDKWPHMDRERQLIG